MRCKKRVRLVIEDGGVQGRGVEAVFHPAGCAHARYSHLDLPPLGVLAELARVRGVRLPCRERGGGVEILVPGLGASVRILPRGAYVLKCRGSVYVMRTRAGMLYVGPLTLSRGEGRRRKAL